MNAIEVNNLCLTRKDFTLNHITFALPEGAILGLIGENGAGKTTTIRLLLNQLTPETGEISLLGQGQTTPALLEQVGVVPDEAGFSPAMTAVQAGKIFGNIYKNWQQETFEGYLKKLDVPMEKPYGSLSLGVKKKLAIAVALSHGARLLLLDEACSGLDPLAREQVLDILFDFTRSEEHSILLSSHIVSDLEKLCDYIAFMHKGQLVLFSEKDRLYETYGLLHCDEETLATLPKEAVLGKRVTEYSATALVKRELVPAGGMLLLLSVKRGTLTHAEAGERMLVVSAVTLGASALTLPFLFRFGTEKGRIAYYFFFGGFCVLLPLLTIQNQSFTQISLLEAAILLYALSWWISVQAYKKRMSA